VSARYDFRRRREDETDELEADELLRAVSEDLLESGDLDGALDRVLSDGFTTPDGRRVEGLRDLLERVRQRRRDLESRANPDAELERYREWLNEIEAREDAELGELAAQAATSGDERRAAVTGDLVAQRRLQRELMSQSLGERLTQYQSYEFVSSEAREQYEALMDQLSRDVLDTYFEHAKSALTERDPAALARMREMMDALSTMIEQDRAGEPLSPSFEEFMERYGDVFPGATSLEDVVRALAERAAAAEAMMNALSGDQQGELRALVEQMMTNMELDFSMHRLTANLRQAAPDLDWQRATRLRGGEPTSFAESTSRAQELGELRALEDFVTRAHPAQGLPEVDVEAVRRHLGADAASQVTRLQRALRDLRDRGFIDREGSRTTLTARGVRQIGQQALTDLFGQLRHSPVLGGHREASLGGGGDREETSAPWEPGEPFSLNLARTLRNAVLRQGPGTPVRLHPDDFEVEEYEATRRAATVFAIDLSLSMAMRGNLVPAKKMVLALTQLIRSAFPRDLAAVVGFGELAQELRVEDIPALTIDYNYGTNLQHALALGRHLLRGERGERQIVVVTDGEPTAHLQDDGQPFFSWPPVRETLERTMAEVLRCTRAGIVINVFALDTERTQFPFVEQIARVNGGRTFYTSVDDLGRYVLDDVVRHHRAG
jgi:uncharacterized protein with von Willebrand factor type A (vWA) domain